MENNHNNIMVHSILNGSTSSLKTEGPVRNQNADAFVKRFKFKARKFRVIAAYSSYAALATE